VSGAHVWRRNLPCARRCNKEYLLNSIHCAVRFFLPDLRITSWKPDCSLLLVVGFFFVWCFSFFIFFFPTASSSHSINRAQLKQNQRSMQAAPEVSKPQAGLKSRQGGGLTSSPSLTRQILLFLACGITEGKRLGEERGGGGREGDRRGRGRAGEGEGKKGGRARRREAPSRAGLVRNCCSGGAGRAVSAALQCWGGTPPNRSIPPRYSAVP